MDERLQLRFYAHGRDLLFKRLCGASFTAADGDDLRPTWETLEMDAPVWSYWKIHLGSVFLLHLLMLE